MTQSEKPTISPEYLAGFIDGEGYLGILRIANGPRRLRHSPEHPWKVYNRSPEHIVRVQVANTNLEGLRAIHAIYGGSLKPMSTPTRPKNRQAYKITWNSRKAERILHLVEPYLILKRPQCLLLLEFIGHRQKNRRLGGSTGHLDPDVVAVRDDFHRRLKELNRKGPREGDGRALLELLQSPNTQASPAKVENSQPA